MLAAAQCTFDFADRTAHLHGQIDMYTHASKHMSKHTALHMSVAESTRRSSAPARARRAPNRPFFFGGRRRNARRGFGRHPGSVGKVSMRLVFRHVQFRSCAPQWFAVGLLRDLIEQRSALWPTAPAPSNFEAQYQQQARPDF